MINEVSCLPLDFEPGTDFAYSDTGYFVLGLVIERVSGLLYARFLQDRLFAPLGMNSTGMMGPIGTDDGRAVGYAWRDDRFVRGPALSPVVEGPSGGHVSTLADLARFDAALSGDRLLPRSTFENMWTPARIGGALYGLGFGVRPIDGRRQVGHTGGGPSAATSFARFVDDDITVILLTNTSQPPTSVQTLVDAVADAVLGPRTLGMAREP